MTKCLQCFDDRFVGYKEMTGDLSTTLPSSEHKVISPVNWEFRFYFCVFNGNPFLSLSVFFLFFLATPRLTVKLLKKWSSLTSDSYRGAADHLFMQMRRLSHLSKRRWMTFPLWQNFINISVVWMKQHVSFSGISVWTMHFYLNGCLCANATFL